MLIRSRGMANTCCLIASLAVSFLLFHLSSVSAEREGPARSPWKGHALFREKGCITCHSIYGKGGEGGGDLGKRKFYGTYLELAATLWNHLPAMLEKMEKTKVEFPHLDGEEMQQIVVYLSYMKYIGERGNARKGRSLLHKKGCTKCHSIESSDDDIGPDIFTREEYVTPLMLIESMWNHVPEMAGVFEERDVNLPKFKGNDIVNIASGIESYAGYNRSSVGDPEIGHPAEGEVVVREKGCLHCHSGKSSNGRLGPKFEDLDFEYSASQIAGNMWNHSLEMWESMQNQGLSFPIFEKGELQDVIAYLYSLQLEDEPGDPAKGRRILELRCLSCHTLGGQGVGASPDLEELTELNSTLDMIAVMWNHAPKMREEQVGQNLKWPKFNGEEMADVHAYLRNISSVREEDRDDS